LYWITAIHEEMIINTTISVLMIRSCNFSLIFLITLPFRKSSVKVDAEAMTREESVLMDAANTKTMTTPIITSPKFESMAGTMASKTTPPPGLYIFESEYNLPKLPRK